MTTNPSRSTVTIIGLRYGQDARITKKCGDIVNLKFVDADQSETVLPASDAVFVLTRFIEHRWTNAAHRYFPRNRVHLHAGGISSLVRRIRALSEEEMRV